MGWDVPTRAGSRSRATGGAAPGAPSPKKAPNQAMGNGVTVATVLVIPLLAVLDRPKHPPDLGVSYQSALFPPTLNVDVLNKSRAPISELHLWAVETPPKGAPASFVPGRFEVELRGLVS